MTIMARRLTCAGALTTLMLLGACSMMPTAYPTVSSPPPSGTHVRLMRGLGGAALSPGVDQIAASAAKIHGVTLVKVYEYTQTQQIADEINAEGLDIKEVIGGYSCGANASPVVASGVSRSIDMLTVIQASEWCGGVPIPKNVKRAQETYNPDCAQTAGLGCKELELGPGFNPANFTVIIRPDCHPCADVNPDAQADMLRAISSVANPAPTTLAHSFLAPSRAPARKHQVNRVVLYHGQHL